MNDEVMNYVIAYLLIPVLAVGALPRPSQARQERSDAYPAQEVTPVRIDESIAVDGRLDEAAWSRAAVANGFLQYWPDDASPARAETEVRLLYDDGALYVGVIGYGLRAAPVIQSLRRDIEDEFWRSDAVAIVLDPFDESNSGFLFGVNAGNAQLDGILNSTAETTDLDVNWSTRWYSATTATDSVWYVEIAVPFDALQFGESSPRWGFNVLRNDMQGFEFSTWSPVPLPRPMYDLGHSGDLVWADVPAHSSQPIALRPYAAGVSVRDFEGSDGVGSELRVGGDLHYPITPSLNLNVAVNPDFSNVEVDEHVINLTRFDITLPERRPFFLENGDIFANLGHETARTFFSRRIGLDGGAQIPISYGVRLTGNVASSLRVGVMNVQTRGHGAVGAQNFAMAAIQQQVMRRSQIRGFFLNRQAEHPFSGADDYNRVGGIEATLISPDGRLGALAMHHRAFTEQRLDDNALYAANVNYAARRWSGGVHVLRAGRNYVSDAGFIPRLYHYDAAADTTVRRGFTNGAVWLFHTIIPNDQRIWADHDIGAYSDQHYDEGGRLTDRVSGVWYDAMFAAGHFLHTYVDYFEEQLPFETRLLGDRFEPLPAASYTYTRTGFQFDVDSRRDLAGSVGIEAGRFYDGTRLTLETQMIYRASPRIRLGARYAVNRVDFPEPYGSATLHLIGPRLLVSFSNTLSWTTFAQYNTQTENVNVNSRLQWRFRPMSDLFLVYNDNMDTHALAPRNRGVTFKVTYWLDV